MNWYIILIYIALIICLISCFYIFIKLIKLGKPKDYSKERGSVKKAVIYSLTKAMNPKKKESAYLNLPTYTAGMIYHIGIFVSFTLLIFFLIGFEFNLFFSTIISIGLFISALSGLFIFAKRFFAENLRSLSNIDDYLSNILATFFPLFTIAYLFTETPLYFVWTSILLLYLPIGKLKHAVYFFSARYHLGFFYGRRGVWPSKK